MMLVNSLSTLINKKAVMRYSHVSNELNNLYDEGVKAHKLGHFAERHFVDLTFGASCDGCGNEIEFLLFLCLGCRNRSICEQCYFAQLEEESDSDTELENELRAS